MKYKHRPVERTIWNEIANPSLCTSVENPVYPRTGARIMLFFPASKTRREPAQVVFTTYDGFSNWVPRPSHWARMLEGPL